MVYIDHLKDILGSVPSTLTTVSLFCGMIGFNRTRTSLPGSAPRVPVRTRWGVRFSAALQGTAAEEGGVRPGDVLMVGEPQENRGGDSGFLSIYPMTDIEYPYRKKQDDIPNRSWLCCLTNSTAKRRASPQPLSLSRPFAPRGRDGIQVQIEQKLIRCYLNQNTFSIRAI